MVAEIDLGFEYNRNRVIKNKIGNCAAWKTSDKNGCSRKYATTCRCNSGVKVSRIQNNFQIDKKTGLGYAR
jgi:hypothetical protein